MFNYSVKKKIILVVIFLALLILVIIVVQKNYSRSRDLQVISQAKLLATGLEKYYVWHNAYPLLELSAGQSVDFVSNNGVNVSGDIYYFNRDFDWARDISLASNGQSYEIKFDLGNAWQTFNITQKSGGHCHIISNVILECINKE